MIQTNPWKYIPLQEYESHMQLETVKQLQTLNEIMECQFDSYDIKKMMILGIAGGNGLEHINLEKIQRVYGVDVNEDYLRECRKRYPELSDTLVTIQIDLMLEENVLPEAEFVVANLLVEYIGYEKFKATVEKVNPLYVSCVIQINNEESFVSNSPYIHTFDSLEIVHHELNEELLSNAMNEINYQNILREVRQMPNGKKLVRLDYKRNR